MIEGPRLQLIGNGDFTVGHACVRFHGHVMPGKAKRQPFARRQGVVLEFFTRIDR